jgi:hypothetical protein
MTTKLKRGPHDCDIEDFYDDEPYFIIRAKDPSAAETVRSWVNDRIHRWGVMHPDDPMPADYKAKLDEAWSVAQQMEDWYNANEGKRNNNVGPLNLDDLNSNSSK